MSRLLTFFRGVNVLLVFVPISFVLVAMHQRPLWIFSAAALSIIPFAGMMGTATEELANRLGQQWGGLLNATFGNATELIIGIVGIHAGLLQFVRASLIGSIIGNVLLVLGASILVGGLRHRLQQFNRDVARSQSINLLLAVLSLSVPSIFAGYSNGSGHQPADHTIGLSIGVSIILLIVYAVSLYFAMARREDLFRSGPDTPMEPSQWKLRYAVGLLAVATIAVAFESEFLVNSVTQAAKSIGVNQVFVGIIIVPIIGNAAEHSTAVLMAWKNKMDITLNIAIGSSAQVAMFVAPFLTLCSLFLHHPMSYIFKVQEQLAVGFAVLIAAIISIDGKSHWLEGIQLLGAYIIIALAFYFLP